MADPYKTLGVEKTATEEDIRKTYKKLAKKHHPDLNPGDKEAEERFKASRSPSAGSIVTTRMRARATATSAPRIWAILATSLAICSAGAPKAAKALARSSACAAPT